MRSLSSIIKSGKIYHQGTINLTERRLVKEVKEVNQVNDGSIYFLEREEKVEPKEQESMQEGWQQLEVATIEEIKQNQLKAETILKEAYEKASQLEKEAREMYTELMNKAACEKEQVLQNAQEQGDQIRQQAIEEKQQLLNSIEDDVAETLVILMQHLLSEEVNYNSKWLCYIIRRMLQQQPIDEEVILYISQENFEKLKTNSDKYVTALIKDSKVRVNEALNDTTCWLQTSQGNIEYDVQQGLEKMISEIRILKSLHRS